MKIVRFLHGKTESYGALTTEFKVVDLLKLSKVMKRVIPASLDELILLGRNGLNKVERLIKETNEKEKAKATIRLSNIKLLAPVRLPPKIICLGLNYRAHAAEQNASLPDEPIVFMKPHTAVIGPTSLLLSLPL